MSLQVNITNNSGISSSDVHWICFGLDSDPATSSPSWSYVATDAKGNASLQKFTKGQDCTKLFKTVDELNSFNGLPKMWCVLLTTVFINWIGPWRSRAQKSAL